MIPTYIVVLILIGLLVFLAISAFVLSKITEHNKKKEEEESDRYEIEISYKIHYHDSSSSKVSKVIVDSYKNPPRIKLEHWGDIDRIRVYSERRNDYDNILNIDHARASIEIVEKKITKLGKQNENNPDNGSNNNN